MVFWFRHAANPSEPSTSDTSGSRLSAVSIGGQEYQIVSSAVALIEHIDEYLSFHRALPEFVTETGQRLVEIVALFNSRSCQLLLGAQAMRVSGLRSITAKHLALCSQCIYLLVALHAPLIALLLGSEGQAQRAILQPDLDRLKQVSFRLQFLFCCWYERQHQMSEDRCSGELAQGWWRRLSVGSQSLSTYGYLPHVGSCHNGGPPLSGLVVVMTKVKWHHTTAIHTIMGTMILVQIQTSTGRTMVVTIVTGKHSCMIVHEVGSTMSMVRLRGMTTRGVVEFVDIAIRQVWGNCTMSCSIARHVVLTEFQTSLGRWWLWSLPGKWIWSVYNPRNTAIIKAPRNKWLISPVFHGTDSIYLWDLTKAGRLGRHHLFHYLYCSLCQWPHSVQLESEIISWKAYLSALAHTASKQVLKLSKEMHIHRLWPEITTSECAWSIADVPDQKTFHWRIFTIVF